MCRISVKLILILGITVLASAGVFADDRINLRLNQKRIDDRIATPRLALGTLKEKDKDKEIQVTKKRITAKKTTRRITKDDKERKKKTKRVVASQ